MRLIGRQHSALLGGLSCPRVGKAAGARGAGGMGCLQHFWPAHTLSAAHTEALFEPGWGVSAVVLGEGAPQPGVLP